MRNRKLQLNTGFPSRKTFKGARVRFEAERLSKEIQEIESKSLSIHKDMPYIWREIFCELYSGDAGECESDMQGINKLSAYLNDVVKGSDKYSDLCKLSNGDGIIAGRMLEILSNSILENCDIPNFSEKVSQEDREEELNDWVDWMREDDEDGSDNDSGDTGTQDEGDDGSEDGDMDGNGQGDSGSDSGDDGMGQGFDLQAFLDECEEDSAGKQVKDAIADAISKAVEEGQEIKDTVKRGFGADTKDLSKQFNKTGDNQGLQDLKDMLASNDEFKEFLDLIGSMRVSMQKSRNVKPSKARVVPYSVEEGNDLRSLLPIERIRLCLPETQDEATLRYMEGRCLQLAKRDNVAKDSGDFHILLDISPSMFGQGGPIQLAKAACVAALTIAADEGRKTSLTLFASHAEKMDVDFSTASGRVESTIKIFNITDGHCGWGTAFDPPFRTCADLIRASGDDTADVFLLSDGQGRVNPNSEDFKLCTEDSSLYYFVIGRESQVNQDIKDAATDFVLVNDLFDNRSKVVDALTSAVAS